MIIGVDMHIIAAQIASIAEIVILPSIQIDGDFMLLLGDDFGDLFGVKISGFSVFEDKNIADFAGKPCGIEFDARGADGTDNASPVRIASMDGALDQWIIGHGAGRPGRIGLR